jgi:nucleoside-diphosphate-sugar epimerase
MLYMSDLWKALEGKKVFIAGFGFYGKSLYNELIKNRIETEYGSRSENGWNILDPRTYTKFQIKADYIINCAGRSDVNGDTAVLGNGPIILGASVKPSATLLQISSGVVGKNIKNPYANAKRQAEWGLTQFDNVKIVRPFATVGPMMGLDKSFAISTFISRRLNNLPLEVAPGITRSFCYISDLVSQILHVMVLGNNEPYEVGSDDPISMEDAAILISKDVNTIKKTFPSNAGDTYVADLSRIKNELGIGINFSSLEAIEYTLQAYVTAQQTNFRDFL